MLRPRLVLGTQIPKAALSLRLGKSRSSKPNAARFMCSDSAAAALAKKKPAVLRCETESAEGGATVGVAGMPVREAVRGAIAQDVGNHGTPELSLSSHRSMGLDELDLGPGAQAGSEVDVDKVLHVRGLPSTMDRDEILKLFSAIDGGAVVQESKAKRATVLMSSKDLADEAIRVLDSTMVQDKSISISIAKGKKSDGQKKRKKRETKSKSLSVYVEGITEEAELPELVEAFSAIDADASIHATNTAAGFCLLRTSSPDLADQIAASLDGMELRGGPQIVAKRCRKPADDQETAAKKLSPDAESADYPGVGAEKGEKEEASSKYTQHRVEVRNIPSDMRSAELNAVLEALGLAPRGIKLSRQTASAEAEDAPWQNKGYAFAYFATDHNMRQAVSLTNGSTVRGNQITVQVSTPPASKKGAHGPGAAAGQAEARGVSGSSRGGGVAEHSAAKMSNREVYKREVYVCGLDSRVTNKMLGEVFGKVGSVFRVKGPNAGHVHAKTSPSEGTGYGFVAFESEAEAEEAVKVMHGSMLEGQRMTVRRRELPSEGGKYDAAAHEQDADHAIVDGSNLLGGIGGGASSYSNLVNQGTRATASSLHTAPSDKSAGIGGLLNQINWDEKGQQPSRAQSETLSDNDFCAYVSGIAWAWTNKDLVEFAKSHCKGVKNAIVVCEQHPQTQQKIPKGYGFIWFNSREAVEEGISAINGQMCEDRTIVCKPRIKASERQAYSERSEQRSLDQKEANELLLKKEKERKLFVGNVPFNVTSGNVKDVFIAKGYNVTDISMPVDVNQDGTIARSKGYCFVTFATRDDAEKALVGMDQYEFMGRRISVHRRDDYVKKDDEVKSPWLAAKTEKKRMIKMQDSRTVYCSRFPLDVSQAQIQDLFSAYGRVESAFVPTVLTSTPNGTVEMCKGFSFIVFEDEASCEAAVESLDGSAWLGAKIIVKRKKKDGGDEEDDAASSPSSHAARRGSHAAQGGRGSEQMLVDSIDLDALKQQMLDESNDDDIVGEAAGSSSAAASAASAASAATPTTGRAKEISSTASAAGGGKEDVEENESASMKGGKMGETSIETDVEVEAAADTLAAPAARSADSPADEEKVIERMTQPKISGRQAKQRKTTDVKEIKLSEGMTIKDLSDAVGLRFVEVIKQLIRLGESPKTINDAVSMEIAELIVTDLGMSPVLPEGTESTRLGRTFSDDEYAALPERPPIVTIMGHVDHGKTTLLDYFRNSSVAAGEAGGITQSIAAFEVERPGLGRICFVDTPGHKAFSAMRERGARATDIVILVVSAVDGVQPQTIEVIQHARAAQVPIIIAVNKCDLPRAEPSTALTALASEGVVVEELGGDVQSVQISALTGMNISSLEESVLLLASMMELRAPTDGPGEGFVVESRKDKALGPVASVIVTLGELKVGDHVVVGGEWGRVRALRDCNRETTECVGPSRVCEVIGFRGQPAAGEELYVVESEKAAVAYAERIALRKAKSAKLASAPASNAASGEASAASQGEEEQAAGRKELPIIVKADVAGSLEALVGSLMALPSSEVAIQIVHAEIGPVTEHDVDVASGVGAHIFTFNCKDPTNAVTKAAKAQKVGISNTKIIYTLLEEVTDHMIDLLPSVTTTEILGEAEVLQMFEIKGKGSTTMVAGCKVVEGTMMQKSTHVQVIRSGEVVHEGTLESLRHHKDVVKEVKSGNECGIVIEGFEAIEVGDEVHCINKVVSKRTSL